MKKILVLITLLIFSASMFAGDVSRKGSTGADQLLVPVGARGIATGGAFHSGLYGLESIYYNPAGLDLTKGTEAMFSYMTYLADINVSYFAVSTVLGDMGSFALSFKTFDFGEIPVTTNDFPDGTGKNYSCCTPVRPNCLITHQKPSLSDSYPLQRLSPVHKAIGQEVYC